MSKLNIKSICQYNGYRGEHRKGIVEILEQPREHHNPIYVYISNYAFRYDDELDEDGEEIENPTVDPTCCNRIAEIRMTLKEAKDFQLKLSEVISSLEKAIIK